MVGDILCVLSHPRCHRELTLSVTTQGNGSALRELLDFTQASLP